MKTESVKESYELAKSWFLDTWNNKGIFNYLYHAHADEFSTKNNAIRQLMASRLLAELAQTAVSLHDKHRQNLEFIFKHWVVKQDGLSFVLLYKKSKLGANAMLLRTLAASPFFQEYRSQADSLKKTLMHSMNKDGSFVPFLVEPTYEHDADYMLTFYSGEAISAMMELYVRLDVSKKSKADLLKLVEHSQRFYIDKYVVQMEANYYPAYVPWHSISLNQLFKVTENPIYSDAVFTLNHKLLELQDRTNHVGRFFNPATPEYGTPHASSDGVFCEGLAYALELAYLIKDERKVSEITAALDIGFKHLASLQYSESNSGFLPNPKLAIGGFRIRRTAPDAPFSEKTGSNIRIDSVQHTMDAMRKYLQVRAQFVNPANDPSLDSESEQVSNRESNSNLDG